MAAGAIPNPRSSLKHEAASLGPATDFRCSLGTTMVPQLSCSAYEPWATQSNCSLAPWPTRSATRGPPSPGHLETVISNQPVFLILGSLHLLLTLLADSCLFCYSIHPSHFARYKGHFTLTGTAVSPICSVRPPLHLTQTRSELLWQERGSYSAQDAQPLACGGQCTHFCRMASRITGISLHQPHGISAQEAQPGQTPEHHRGGNGGLCIHYILVPFPAFKAKG